EKVRPQTAKSVEPVGALRTRPRSAYSAIRSTSRHDSEDSDSSDDDDTVWAIRNPMDITAAAEERAAPDLPFDLTEDKVLDQQSANRSSHADLGFLLRGDQESEAADSDDGDNAYIGSGGRRSYCLEEFDVEDYDDDDDEDDGDEDDEDDDDKGDADGCEHCP
ncbi:hypothetical protein EGW08_008615, partial [Elysia chlorotica]